MTIDNMGNEFDQALLKILRMDRDWETKEQ